MKKLISLLISLSLILTCMSGISLVASAATPLEGQGTNDNPYLISTAEQFVAIFGNANTDTATTHAAGVTYLLTKDIDLTNSAYKPAKAKFYGNLYGAKDGEISHKITINSDLIQDDAYDANGTKVMGALFNYLESATVKNLEIWGKITRAQNAATRFGVLAGYASSSTIKNVTNYVDIPSGHQYGTGGLIGVAGRIDSSSHYTIIENCRNYGDVNASSSNSRSRAGGMVGEAQYTTISYCYNYGDIECNDYVGGIVGYAKEGTNVSYSANFGDVTATTECAGGIAGRLKSKIEFSYNKGAVNAIYAGGIIGWLSESDAPTVNDCYNLGIVAGTYSGTLLAYLNKDTNKITVKNFYDLVNSESVELVGYIKSGATVTSSATYTSSQIETIKGLVDDSTFNSESKWIMQEGYDYPSLANNPYQHNLTGAGDSTSPYRIYTTTELKMVDTYPAATYIQMLDLTGMDKVLCSETEFTGTYDGNGKSIILAIDTSDKERVFTALFAKATAATIKNLTTDGFVKSGFNGNNDDNGTAAFVGYAGRNDSSKKTTLLNCKNYASVTSTGYRTAGFVASSNGVDFDNCYNYGNIFANREAAGIIARLPYTGTVDNCGNYGEITSYYTAAGISILTQSANLLSGLFNVGTITATDNTEGQAAGLIFGYNKDAKGVANSYNAGVLIAKTTYGIAYSNASASGDGWTVDNCYNAVYADYPIAKTETDTLKVTNCYYLADADTDGLDNTTAVAPANLITAPLGDAYSIVNDYKYPQLTANKLDTEKDNIDFYLVTVTDNTENETEVKLNTGKVGSFYLPGGATLKVNATAQPYFYYATIDGENLTEKDYTISGALTVVIADGKTEKANVEEETISTVDAFEGTEAITVGDETFNEYSLVYAKVNWNPSGLKLVGFGILQGLNEDMTKDNYENNFAGTNGKISSDGAFGILIHNAVSGEGLQEGTTYYFIPYGSYVDVDGNPYTIYGDVNPFTYNVVE